MDAPPGNEAARIERALKAAPVSWREVTRRGQTNASNWLVELAEGTTAFVKCARGDDTASWIRDGISRTPIGRPRGPPVTLTPF